MTSITIAGIGIGLYSPLITYALEAAGRSRTIIGLNTAVFALAILVFASTVPKLMRRFGTVPVLWSAFAATIVSLILFRLSDSLIVWFIVRFSLGLGLTAVFVATEIWINLIAEENSRGRVLGIYATCLSGGVSLGLGILFWMGSTGWGPILMTSSLFAVAGLVLIPTRTLAPRAEAAEEKSGILPFLKVAPTALLAALIFGAVEMGILNLLNIYGLRSGLTEASGTMMLLVISLGSIVFQVPIGMLSDRMDRRLVLVGCAATGMAAAVLIPAAIHNPLALYAILFVMGGIILGMYAVGLTLVGERFRGGDLAAANAAFVTMYGLGALVGPSLGGIAMDIWDPNGLMVVLAALCGGYALVIFARMRRKASLTGGSG